MTGTDELAAGDVVTAEQMQALFGSRHHTLAEQRREQLQGPGLTDKDYQGVTRLGCDAVSRLAPNIASSVVTFRAWVQGPTIVWQQVRRPSPR